MLLCSTELMANETYICIILPCQGKSRTSAAAENLKQLQALFSSLGKEVQCVTQWTSVPPREFGLRDSFAVLVSAASYNAAESGIARHDTSSSCFKGLRRPSTG